MMFNLNVQFKGSAINLLVSRKEASRGSTEPRTMSMSGFDLEKHRLKGRSIRSKT
jgi:hypothetical protein